MFLQHISGVKLLWSKPPLFPNNLIGS